MCVWKQASTREVYRQSENLIVSVERSSKLKKTIETRSILKRLFLMIREIVGQLGLSSPLCDFLSLHITSPQLQCQELEQNMDELHEKVKLVACSWFIVVDLALSWLRDTVTVLVERGSQLSVCDAVKLHFALFIHLLYHLFISFGCQHYETICQKQEADEKAHKTGEDAQENINTEETTKEEKKPASQNKQLQLFSFSCLHQRPVYTMYYLPIIFNMAHMWELCLYFYDVLVLIRFVCKLGKVDWKRNANQFS